MYSTNRVLSIVLLLFITLFSGLQAAQAQRVYDSKTISEYLDNLVLTADERVFLQDMYETVGLPTVKIVGGEDADIADYPWHVALTTQSGSQFCGGTILDAEWVMTAAHCVNNNTQYIRAGVTNRNDTSGQDRSTSQVIRHPQYVTVTQGKDIAMLRLSQPLDFSDPNVQPIGISTQMHADLGFEDEGVPS